MKSGTGFFLKAKHIHLLLVVLLLSPLAAAQKEGEEVGWWKLPGVIVAGDDDVCGFAWDGSQLWVANNSYQKNKGRAYRLDINSAANGSTPAITRVIDYAGNSVEGIDHDRNGHLYVGMRYKQSRSSASIVKYDDQTGAELKRYTSFAYPNDSMICKSYTDPDGTVLDLKGNLYWCVKGDHYKECNPIVANTAVQMMTLSGTVVKRFWLPWYYATPAFYDGYFIYKRGGRFTSTPSVYPYPDDIIEIVKIDGIQNNTTARISKTVEISGPHYHSDKRYLGATYFDDHLYLINQDTDPVHIIKIYLPLESAPTPAFKKHVIKPPRPTTKNNTVPSMVWVHDVDGDGQKDIVASHVGMGTLYGPPSDGADHPYVAWYKGPSFTQEFIMIDKNTPGQNGNSRIYRFVMYDVDKDGKKDLIGQGYQPFHNGNKWYKCPDSPTRPWNEWHDYGANLKNGHDIRLRDINGDGRMEVVLLDSHSGKMIVMQIPSGNAINSPWPYHTVTGGDGMTHYMSFFDVNGDGNEDIIIAKEEDGGKGIKWYEHPGYDKALMQEWKKHFVVNANFTKAFARDLDEDGDIDYIGTGELDGANIGWYKKTASGYTLNEFDKKDNNNDVNGGHNCELVDVDGDGDEDLITGGVYKADGKQRFL